MSMLPAFGKVGKMISVEAAREAVFRQFEIQSFFLKVKSIPLKDSLNKILAEDILADRDQPPFNRVAMDGIAISSKSANLKKFKIEGIQAAGSPAIELKEASNCIEVMTGAVLPRGCDLVIPYEEVDIKSGMAFLTSDFKILNLKNIHTKGSDYKVNETLIEKNKRICSTDISVLASVGKSEVLVHSFPKVGIISTGDELVEVGESPKDYQIRRSSFYALNAELKSFGFESVTSYHGNDNLEELKSTLLQSLNENEITLFTGGVSMGKFDFVPKALSEIGVEEIFHKVKQRPGKPLWFGKKDKKLVFGLPGNPVSSLLTLCTYINQSYMKFFNFNLKTVSLAKAHSFKKKMTLFLPCYLSENGAIPVIGNGSGDYFALTKADGFLELKEMQEGFNGFFQRGESFNFYPWGGK